MPVQNINDKKLFKEGKSFRGMLVRGNFAPMKMYLSKFLTVTKQHFSD